MATPFLLVCGFNTDLLYIIRQRSLRSPHLVCVFVLCSRSLSNNHEKALASLSQNPQGRIVPQVFFLKIKVLFYHHGWMSIWSAFCDCWFFSIFFSIGWWFGSRASRLRPLIAHRGSTGSLVTKKRKWINTYLLVSAIFMSQYVIKWKKRAQLTAVGAMLPALLEDSALLLVLLVCWYNFNLGAGTGLTLISGWASCVSSGCQK